MKKLALLLSPFVLTACAAGIDTSEPVEKRADLNHVCIQERKTGLNYTSKELVQFIQQSLAKKQIQSSTYSKDANCRYLLTYALKGKKELIVRGTIKLADLHGNANNQVGEVSYKYRGDARAEAKLTGIQGQLDKMVFDLFQHY